MANLRTADAATATVTNNTFAHKLGLTDGAFGLQQLESVLSFPARNGRSWTVSIRASDVAIITFTILVLTFAIDYYIFKSRYLVHIGGATRDKDQAAALDEKASLHEKEALSVESGQNCSNHEDSDPEPKSKHNSHTSQSPLPRWIHRAFSNTLLILILLASFGGRNNKEIPSKIHKGILERSSAKAKAEEDVAKTPPTSWWGKFVQDPWSQRVLASAILVLGFLAMLAVIAFHLIFWPLLLAFFILLQCLFHTDLNHGATVPWQPIAIKSTLQLATWTIIGVTLLLKSNRLQGVLWKCFKWTHAVNWWLFWVVFESYKTWVFVARRGDSQSTGTTMEVFLFIIRPSLVAYLYSGVVLDAVVAVRVSKYFWSTDVTKL